MSRTPPLQSPAAARKQPLLTSSSTSSEHCDDGECGSGRRTRRSRMGEMAGGCAAVCCCCPCAMVHLLILAVYRFPRCLWRTNKKRMKLLRKKRRISSEEEANRRKTKALGFYGDEAEELTEDEDRGGENVVVDWDSEMWDRFHGAGFWRSASRRSDE